MQRESSPLKLANDAVAPLLKVTKTSILMGFISPRPTLPCNVDSSFIFT